MKLLVVTRGLEPSTLDPTSAWVYELTGGLNSRGHRVTVLCNTMDGAESLTPDPEGVDVRRPAPEEFATALEQALGNEPDVIHLAAPGALSAVNVRALESAPLLLDVLDWSPLCPAADLLRRPRVERCEQHHPVAPCLDCVGAVQTAAFEPIMSLARAGHHLLARTTYARDRVTLALGRGVALLPVGVDGLRFSTVTAAAGSADVAALAVGRVNRRVVLLGPPAPARGGYRILNLLVALHARVPGLEFVVAGSDLDDSDAMSILRAEARELGLASQLRLFPRVSRLDLPALLAACDVGLALGPSPDPVGLPIVQALAVGLPVVADPVGGAAELLLQGEAGVLVNSQPVGPFADQVAELLADADRRRAYRERGRLAALECHDLERALYDIEALYERVRIPRARRVLGASEPPWRLAA